MVSRKPPRAGAADNLSNQAFEGLRQDILECRLLPNARLPLDDLRERYSVGATPLREALMRLTTDGLVVFTQNRGFRVAPVSRNDLIDATDVQVDINMIAFRKSIALGDDRWEGDLLSSFHRLSKISKQNEIEGQVIMSSEWSAIHREFHRTLVGACGSKWLLSFFDVITDQTTRYIRLSIEQFKVPRYEEGEHRDILDAALQRNADLACDLLKAHLLKTRDNLLAIEMAPFSEVA